VTSEQFRLSSHGKIFSVVDLSKKGMGFWLLDLDDILLFSVGLLIHGTLNVRGEKYSVKARVRNLRSDRVGCEFESLSESTLRSIEKLMDPQVLGKEMKLFPSPGRNSLWYHGPSGTDLLFHKAGQETREKEPIENEYESLILYVLGIFVQWEKEHGVSTGRVILSDQETEVRGIIRLETLFLQPDPSVDLEKLSIAKKVLLSSNLPEDLQSWCVHQLEINGGEVLNGIS
jgi:hypothetical protein